MLRPSAPRGTARGARSMYAVTVAARSSSVAISRSSHARGFESIAQSVPVASPDALSSGTPRYPATARSLVAGRSRMTGWFPASSSTSGNRESTACWQIEWGSGMPRSSRPRSGGATQLAKSSCSSSTTLIIAIGTSSSDATSRVRRSRTFRAAASRTWPRRTGARCSVAACLRGPTLHTLCHLLQDSIGVRSSRARGRLPPPRRAAAAAARRAAARGRGSESARGGDGCRTAGRRACARVGRGGREEPPAPLRRRRRRPQPPPDVRPLARRAARQAAHGAAVAHPPRRGGRGRALERAGADARVEERPPPRPGRARRVVRPRCGRGSPARRRRPPARRGAPGSAARCRNRQHVDGRGACGRSRRRRGCAWERRATRCCTTRSRRPGV